MAALLRILLLVSLFVGGYLQDQYPNCICTADYAPVCGYDGRTYGNRCQAQCRYVPVRCEGRCPCTPSNCICGFIYDPVCGWNGVTYPNPCTARCNGIYFYWPGTCPWDRRNR